MKDAGGSPEYQSEQITRVFNRYHLGGKTSASRAFHSGGISYEF